MPPKRDQHAYLFIPKIPPTLRDHFAEQLRGEEPCTEWIDGGKTNVPAHFELYSDPFLGVAIDPAVLHRFVITTVL